MAPPPDNAEGASRVMRTRRLASQVARPKQYAGENEDRGEGKARGLKRKHNLDETPPKAPKPTSQQMPAMAAAVRAARVDTSA